MDAIFLRYQEKVIDIRAEKEKAKFALESEFEKNPLDEDAVMQEIERIKTNRAAGTEARYLFLLEVRKFLGAERYARLKTCFLEHKK